MGNKHVNIPDLGGIESVTVLEVLVKSGDFVAQDQPLMTLESDKATMDVMAEDDASVVNVLVKVGDKVSEGQPVCEINVNESNPEPTLPSLRKEPITIPDMGGIEQVIVLEVLAQPGDSVEAEQPIITLESDKATMDISAPYSGKILSVEVKSQQSVAVGDVVAMLETEATKDEPSEKTIEVDREPAVMEAVEVIDHDDNELYAGPLVRRLAFELEVSLKQVKGTGNKGRITKEDLVKHIQSKGGGGLPSVPKENAKAFGPVEKVDLTRIQSMAGPHLHACWVNIPHVTQHMDVNITQLEYYRGLIKDTLKKKGVRLTPVVLIIKALADTLHQFGRFNSSLSASGKTLVLKKYVHIGVAVDTEQGLVVPVIKDVDKKSIVQLAEELAETSQQAREGQLKPSQLQGGCMTVSSLGGIGGRYFTPIVNAPEVAILGLSKAFDSLALENEKVVVHKMLPMSISYDHRVIDGAEGARFAVALAQAIDHMVNDSIFDDVKV
ncbi:MAG TPA: 2-oxo acid dehydrogenase subunit E2 [Gammaproteobacteria bacterium]|nr:2-oxo acid dehydrogenase subunit E2 [Gammaproteobacteria bacterium]